MRKWFFLFCMILLVVGVSAELYYRVDVIYSDGKYSVESVDVVYSRLGESNFEGDNFSVVLNSDGSNIYQENFNLAGYNFIENLSAEEAEFEYLTEFSASVYVPYDSSADEIVVYDSYGREIMDVDVSPSFAQQALVNRPELPEAFEEESYAKEIYGFLILFVLAIVATGVLYYHFYHRKKGK